MNANSIVPNLNRLREIAEYFSNKTPKEITFVDADEYEYEIYLVVKKLSETPVMDSFGKLFSNTNELWHTLGSWNYEDEWSREKCEKIIDLAKKASSEIQNYIAELSK